MFGFLDTKKKKFLAALGLQLAVILIMIIYKTAILVGGYDVYLRIAPVDPRDPLRGDYVVFQFQEFSTLNSYQINQYETYNVGDTVYVTIEENGNYYHPIEASKIKPLDDEIFIRGTVTRVSSQGNFQGGFDDGLNGVDIDGLNSANQMNKPRRSPVRNFQSVSVNYGIEEYFIKEGSGRNFNFRSGNNFAHVKVDSEGRAVLKQIYINGKPWP